MSHSPKITSFVTGILTATSLGLLLTPTTASAFTLTSPSESGLIQTRYPLQSTPSGLSGFSQPGWLIADDDDDDDDDDKKRGRRRYKGNKHGNDRVQVVRIDLQRAKNLARQTVEQINGGLNRYRAEASMHGPAAQAPCVDNGDSWTFTFLGGTPGWKTASVESVVTIFKADSRIRVDYNGAVRTVRNTNKWKGLLKLGRLVKQNALVLQLDVLDKPITPAASVFYQVFARRNNQWVSVYRTTATQLVANAGRVSLQPVVIPVSALQLGNVDWSRLELKTIAYASYNSQQVVLQEVAQRYQEISQISSVSRDNDDDD